MANERLRQAMAAARVDVGKVADKTGVDPKTVQRWVSGRKPHARHRWVIAELLKEREDFLWPEEEQGPITAQTAEILAGYAHRADVQPNEWWNLFAKAKGHIDLLGYAMHFLPEQLPELTRTLQDKAKLGCQIRIAIGDPDSPRILERDAEEDLGGTLPARIRATLHQFRNLWDCEGVAIRYHSTPLYNSVFRCDDEMFVTPHLYSLHGSKAPLLHLRRLSPHGIFSGFETHFEAIWVTSKTPERLAVGSTLATTRAYS